MVQLTFWGALVAVVGKWVKGALGCLGVALALVAVGLFCLHLFTVMVLSWVFPGSQFSYSSDSKRLCVFKLTLDNDPKSVMIQVPDDYITALFPGDYTGYEEVELTAYLPDMIAEPDYYRRYPEFQEPGPLTQAQLDQRLVIHLTESYDGPDDPIGIKTAVTDGADYAVAHYPKLIGNPYSMFNGYIWTETGSNKIDGAGDTQTYYIPKENKDYYVSCFGEHSDYSDCTIIFIFGGQVEVEVGMSPNNISRTDLVIKNTKTLLHDLIMKTNRPYLRWSR